MKKEEIGGWQMNNEKRKMKNGELGAGKASVTAGYDICNGG